MARELPNASFVSKGDDVIDSCCGVRDSPV
jgi:hypothetical protein